MKDNYKNIYKDRWFTVEKIDENTFSISEYNHWENMHSFLLTSEKEAVLIDTGLGIDNIYKIVRYMTELPVKVITTHVHWDHIGGHSLFENTGVHEKGVSWFENGIPVPLPAIKNTIMQNGFERQVPDWFDIEKYEIFKGRPSFTVKDNDIIEFGGRKLKVIYTPGHSPCHICLFEENSGYLFTGDLIYSGTLFAFYPSTDPIEFSRSVAKINNIQNVKRIFPSHNNLNISPEIIKKVNDGFIFLKERDLLYQGSGLYEFEDFNIHI